MDGLLIKDIGNQSPNGDGRGPSLSLLDAHALIRRTALIIAVGVLAYLGATLLASRGAWGLLVGSAGLRNVAFEAMGLVLLGVLLRALRWIYFGRVLGWRVPPGPMTVSFIAAYALTATPGKVGELVKASMLSSRYGVSATQCAGTLLVERMTDVAAIILLALFGMFVIGTSSGLLVFAIAAILFAAILVIRSHRLRAVMSERTRHWRGAIVFDKIHRALDASSHLLQLRHLSVGIAIATVSWAGETVATFLIFRQLHVPMDFPTTVATYATATLVAAASFLPGGVGGFEAVMILKATSAGASLSAAATATLILRLCSLWFVTALGTVALSRWLLADGGNRRLAGARGANPPPKRSDRR